MVKVLLFLGLFLVCGNALPWRNCERIDVGLMLDASDRIGYEDFQRVLNFSSHLVGKLNVGLNETRVAAMYFETQSYTVWSFDNANREELIQSLRLIPHSGGRQNIARAMLHVQQDMFLRIYGLRPRLNTSLVIFTNGRSSQISTTIAMRRLRVLKTRLGIRVMVVAVGSDANFRRLNEMASEPANENVFTMDMLMNVVEALKEDAEVECPKCSSDMIFLECGSACPPTCDDSEAACTFQCVRGCFCPEGKVLHEEKCIARSDCPIECPTGMVFQKCGSACPPTCEERKTPCTRQCVRGCFCPEGTFLHEGQCIEKESCPIVCTAPMMYSECGTSCPATCDDPEPQICTFQCVRGCFCPENTVLHEGSCIAREECPIAEQECPETMVYSEKAACTRSCDQRNQYVPCPSTRRSECTCPPDRFLHWGRCVTMEECPPLPGTPGAKIPTRPSPTCPETMIFQYCTGCLKTCKKEYKEANCTRDCRQECTCPQNTWFNGRRCVSLNQCPRRLSDVIDENPKTPIPKICPDTMIWSDCATDVETCVPSMEPQPADSSRCRKGCTCPRNTRWDAMRGCIPAEECPPVTCPPTKVFKTCAKCNLRCNQRNLGIVCPTVCEQKCTCPENMYWLGDRCVEESECPAGGSVQYINKKAFWLNLEKAMKEIRGQIENFFEYQYDENRLEPDSIRNGGQDMFLEGNKVEIYEDDNSAGVEPLIYDRTIQLPRILTTTRTSHPFFSIAQIQNENNEEHTYSVKVSGSFGSGSDGLTWQEPGVVLDGGVAVFYHIFQVFNASTPTVCQVFFSIENTAWESTESENYETNFQTNAEIIDNESIYQIIGSSRTPKNALVGYMLLSKRNGEKVHGDEVFNVMRILARVAAMTDTTSSLPEIPKYDYLPRFWLRSSKIEQNLDEIFEGMWYNYTYDDVTEPINSIATGGNNMFNVGNQIKMFMGVTQPDELTIYNQKQKNPVYDIAIGGSRHPFMAMMWISNQNSYKTDIFQIHVEHQLGIDGGFVDSRRHRLVGDFNDPNIFYHYYQTFGTDAPSVCQLFFSIEYRKWNSEGNPQFDLLVEPTSTVQRSKITAYMRGQPRNTLMGYVLLSKQNGERVTIEEMERFLSRLSELLIGNCPSTMVYSECSGCNTNCEDRDRIIPCSFVCRDGCTCPPNTYLFRGRCVPEEFCPALCPPTMIRTSCVGCVPTCKDVGRVRPCLAICRRGCACPKNTFLHLGRCVPADQCPNQESSALTGRQRCN